MFKKCDSTLFKKVTYEVSLNDTHKEIFSMAIYSRCCLLEDDIEKRTKVNGFEVKVNKNDRTDRTKIEIQITPKNGSLSDILGELHFALSKANEYNVLFSRDREAIREQFNQFLKDNNIESQCSTRTYLGNFSTDGNAF